MLARVAIVTVAAAMSPSQTIQVFSFLSPVRILLLRSSSLGHGVAHWSVSLALSHSLASLTRLRTAATVAFAISMGLSSAVCHASRYGCGSSCGEPGDEERGKGRGKLWRRLAAKCAHRAPSSAVATDEDQGRKRETRPVIREHRAGDLVGSNLWSLRYRAVTTETKEQKWFDLPVVGWLTTSLC